MVDRQPAPDVRRRKPGQRGLAVDRGSVLARRALRKRRIRRRRIGYIHAANGVGPPFDVFDGAHRQPYYRGYLQLGSRAADADQYADADHTAGTEQRHAHHRERLGLRHLLRRHAHTPEWRRVEPGRRFGDTYATAPLDAQWTGGAWAGGAYTPTVSGGVLTVDNGNFVRSTATRAVTTLEAHAQFGNAPWQHIGWGDLNFANNRYLLFSTFNNSTNLWARSANNGPEQRTDLGPIPAGMHTYRIERVGNAVRYSIDGTLRAEHTLANVPALHVYQSYNSSAGTTLQVDRLWTYPDYALSGSIDSCVLDGGTA